MKKNGFGLIGLIIIIAVLGFVGIYGFQIGKVYMNKSLITKAIKNTLEDNVDNYDISPNQIKKEIMNKLSLAELQFSESDIIVNKVGRKFNVEAEYSENIGLTDSISILLNFEISDSSN